MKIIALLTATLLLTACGPRPVYVENSVEVCTGKLEKIDERHYRMNCVGGEVINYTSYKYAIRVNGK